MSRSFVSVQATGTKAKRRGRGTADEMLTCGLRRAPSVDDRTYNEILRVLARIPAYSPDTARPRPWLYLSYCLHCCSWVEEYDGHHAGSHNNNGSKASLLAGKHAC